MRPRVSFLVIAGLVVLAAPVVAQDFYVGGGIGNTFYSSDFSDAVSEIGKIDDNATAWKLFGGFSPAQFLGLEGGYRSFGTAEATLAGTSFEAKTTGWDVEALGRIRIAIVDVFGKAGAMFWSQKVTFGSLDIVDDSGTDFLWGLGAGLHLGPIGVRAEWESITIEDDLGMVSLGATLGF